MAAARFGSQALVALLWLRVTGFCFGGCWEGAEFGVVVQFGQKLFGCDLLEIYGRQ